MEFKELTSKQIEYVKKTYSDKSKSWEERILILQTFFGKSERTTRKWLVNLEIIK